MSSARMKLRVSLRRVTSRCTLGVRFGENFTQHGAFGRVLPPYLVDTLIRKCKQVVSLTKHTHRITTTSTSKTMFTLPHWSKVGAVETNHHCPSRTPMIRLRLQTPHYCSSREHNHQRQRDQFSKVSSLAVRETRLRSYVAKLDATSPAAFFFFLHELSRR